MRLPRTGDRGAMSSTPGHDLHIRNAKPVTATDTFDFQEVAHLQAVTPLVTSRAAVEKRKQRVQEEAARRENKENEHHKKAKVIPGAEPSAPTQVMEPNQTPAAGDVSTSTAPRSTSTSSSTSTNTPPERQSAAPAPAPGEATAQRVAAVRTGVVRYPRIDYQTDIPPSAYVRDDTPVELQLLQCVRLHLQADVQRVTEMLQDTKYSHLGQEMHKFAEWRVLEGMERALEMAVQDDKELKSSAERAGAEVGVLEAEVADLEGQLQRLKEQMEFWEEQERRLTAEEEGESPGQQEEERKEEDEEEGAEEEPSILRESKVVLQGARGGEQDAEKRFAAKLEMVESRVEAGRQAESGAREVEEKLVAMAKAALFKGIPHLDQPQEALRKLTSALDEGEKGGVQG